MRADRLDLFDWYDQERDLLKCLICSRWFKGLSAHITLRHKIDAREYRESYGIFHTTPLMAKNVLQGRSENMFRLRKRGVAVVSEKGKVPEQLKGKGITHKRLGYVEFDNLRRKTSEVHKGKFVNEKTRERISDAKKGKPSWNKGKQIFKTIICEYCGSPRKVRSWEKTRFCNKSCSQKKSQNWRKRWLVAT